MAFRLVGNEPNPILCKPNSEVKANNQSAMKQVVIKLLCVIYYYLFIFAVDPFYKKIICGVMYIIFNLVYLYSLFEKKLVSGLKGIFRVFDISPYTIQIASV